MIIVGHRGASGLAPENTIKALELGRDLADGVEFDVRVTKDKVPILNHDAGIFDKDSRRWLIKDYSYSQLKKLRPSLATLEEALSLKYGKTRVFIEIKALEPTEPIIQVIRPYFKKRRLQIAIGSFDFEVLKKVRTQLPEVQLFINERWSSLRANWRARQLNTNQINIEHRFLWFGLVSMLSRRGIVLYTYTLNDPRKARNWQKHGLAGVFTDFPNLFTRKVSRLR